MKKQTVFSILIGYDQPKSLSKFVAWLIPLICLISVNGHSQMIFEDKFDDGIVNTAIYTPIGNAVLTEANGKMTIRALAKDDGVSILMPSGGKCISLKQFVPQSELDVGDEWAIRGFFSNSAGNEERAGVDPIEAFRVSLLRPHWNRCQVKITIAEKTQVVGFWGCSENSLKRACPKTTENMRIDWLKTPDGRDSIQVELKQEDGSYRTVAGRTSELSHEHDDWVTLEIVMLDEGKKNWTCPDPDGIGGGIDPGQGDPPGLVMELEDLLVTGDHPNPPPAPVSVFPSEVFPGTFIDDMLITLSDFPLFQQSNAHFYIGPGFLISDVQVIDGFNATADVFVSDRAPKDGTFLQVEGGDDIIAQGVINVNRESPPEINTAPDMQFDCPVDLAVDQPFTLPVFVNDEDRDIVAVEAVLEKNEVIEEILLEFPQRTFETPTELVFEFPGLPAGEYIILGLANDGLVADGGSLCACAFSVIDTTVNVRDTRLGDHRVRIYPNPVQTELSVIVEAKRADQVHLRLLSIYGESLLQRIEPIRARENQLTIYRPTALAPGVYFLEMSTPTGRLTRKVVFQ